MNSSLPNDDKDKAPQGAQTVATATPSSSDSDSSKGEAGPMSQYHNGISPVRYFWTNCWGQNSCIVYILVHGGILYFTGLACLLSAYYRIKMSNLYKLPNDPLINILLHVLCEPCALCQEYRELQTRGFNMQLGVGW
nr:PLAC8 motif-containing protein [Tanacetum cinerariifolium]